MQRNTEYNFCYEFGSLIHKFTCGRLSIVCNPISETLDENKTDFLLEKIANFPGRWPKVDLFLTFDQ